MRSMQKFHRECSVERMFMASTDISRIRRTNMSATFAGLAIQFICLVLIGFKIYTIQYFVSFIFL